VWNVGEGGDKLDGDSGLLDLCTSTLASLVFRGNLS
jgi:hypothetical protein